MVTADIPDDYLLVGDVVRDVVAKVAAEELPLLDRLRELGDDRARRLLQRRTSGRDLLGFGIDEVVILASPIVWFVLNEAAARFAGDTVAGGGRAVGQWLRGRLGRGRPAPALPPLAPEQIAEVRAQVLDSAVRGGMDAERAALVADAVAARLILGGSPDPEQPSTEDGTGTGS